MSLRPAPLALCLAAALAGCQGAIGLTGYTFVDESGLAGASGAGGAGAAGAGVGGKGGAGAATCVQEPPMVSASALKACAYFTGCTYPVNTSLGLCLSSNIAASTLGLSCLSMATSCNDVYDCLGEALTDPSACSGVGWSCDGARSLQCATDPAGERYARQIDCQKFGGTCNTAGGGDADPLGHNCVLSGASCAAPNQVACIGSNGQAGGTNSVLACADGVAFGQNCDLITGDVCAVDSEQKIACVSPDTCAGLMPGQATCSDATTLTFCDAYGTPFSYDCSNANLVCAADIGGSGAGCVPLGCTVEQTQALGCQESCSADKTTANVCVAGVSIPVDCAEINQGTCMVEPVAGTTQTTALCRPGTLATAM